MGKEQKSTEKHGAIVALDYCLMNFAGKSVATSVMEGSEKLTEKTDKREVALWLKGAMERLEATTDEKTRIQIMQNCGYNCAKVNRRIIDKAIERRAKYANNDDFLRAEMKNPMRGTRLVRDGDILYQVYTPQTFTRPMRCFCGLMSGLPIDETVPLTYCNCGKGFVEKYWVAVLQKPVKVDLLQSAISGGTECKFAIHL